VKYRYVLLVAIFSFVSGGLLAGLVMQSEIDTAISKIDSINKDLFSQTENFLLESNRFGLKAESKLIRKNIELDNKGAPRKYIGEQYINILSMRIENLDKYKANIADESLRNGVEKSIDEAKKLILEIEFSYL